MRIGYGLHDQLAPFAGLHPAQIGEQLRAMGWDGVFLKTLTPEWVTGLQAAGLRVFASFGVFVDNNADLWQRWPESRPITDEGTPAPVQEWYRPLLPSHPEVRAHRLEQFEALVASLPLDGVWLDFIRWPARWEQAQPRLYHSSFDALTLAQFQRETGVALPAKIALDQPRQAAEWILQHAAEAWFAWRCRQIETFVAAAAARLRAHRPAARLGLFTVPWTGTALDQLDVAQAPIRIVGQDPVGLGRHADVLSPMVYHRLCSRPVAWIGQVARHLQAEIDTNGGNTAVWPVVEAIEAPEQYTAAEFIDAHNSARAAAASGVIVFKLDGVLRDPVKVEQWRFMDSGR